MSHALAAMVLGAALLVGAWVRGKYHWRSCPRCEAPIEWMRQGVPGWFGRPWACQDCGVALRRGTAFAVGGMLVSVALLVAITQLVLGEYVLSTLGTAALWMGVLLLVFGQRVRPVYRAGQCPACGYDLEGSPSGPCPECGRRVGEAR